MAPITGAHHHRSTTKVDHKPFKSKHSTKSALKEQAKGKIEKEERGRRRTPHQQVMSKLDRRNKAKQERLVKHHANVKATSIFQGRNGAPRIVAVVPLCDDVDATTTINQLNSSLDIDGVIPVNGLLRVYVERFKQTIQYIGVERDLLKAMDACRIADFVVFVLSASKEVDDLGELIIRSVKSQGMSTAETVVQGLDAVEPPKKRPQVLSSLKSFMNHFFPQEKVHSLDSRQESSNVLRSICNTTPKGVKWREDRTFMLVEDVEWPTELEMPALTGVIRGQGLKADRLVQIGDFGDFQIEKIVSAPLDNRRKKNMEDMAIDDTNLEDVLQVPSEDQDDLAELAPEEVAMSDVGEIASTIAAPEKKGVLLDDHHYFSDDDSHVPEMPKRLPKGTSKYQAAWYLGDVSDSGSDIEDNEDDDGDVGMKAPALPQDGTEGLDLIMEVDPTEAAPSEYPQSEMLQDLSDEQEAQQLAAYRSQRKTEAEEDLEFPDEIELHPDVLAKERLARYRGLKSLRTSVWETEEDRPHEPEDWHRLLQIENYDGVKRKMLSENLAGGIAAGTRVKIYLRQVPKSIRDKMITAKGLTLFSLLRHEHKRAVANYTISLDSEYPTPLRSKEELIMQCGPRRLVINPLFSQPGKTPNNVHKFDRFLHPGRTAMATLIGPMAWGSVPVLYFKRVIPVGEEMPDASSSTSALSFQLVGTGTSQRPDQARVVAKRIILTGHPYKIHKKLVTVRYMFFSADDVNWFKALQLWTKRGRSGFIKESLGTHGYFKATFDGKINPQDAIGVSLYKRVFPRASRSFQIEHEVS